MSQLAAKQNAQDCSLPRGACRTLQHCSGIQIVKLRLDLAWHNLDCCLQERRWMEPRVACKRARACFSGTSKQIETIVICSHSKMIQTKQESSNACFSFWKSSKQSPSNIVSLVGHGLQHQDSNRWLSLCGQLSSCANARSSWGWNRFGWRAGAISMQDHSSASRKLEKWMTSLLFTFLSHYKSKKEIKVCLQKKLWKTTPDVTVVLLTY